MQPSRLGPGVCTCTCVSSAIRDGGGPLPVLHGPSAGGEPGDDLARSDVNGAQHELPRPFEACPDGLQGRSIRPQCDHAMRRVELDPAAHCVPRSARAHGSLCARAIRRATGGRYLRRSADSGHGHGRGHGEPGGSAHAGIGQWRLRCGAGPSNCIAANPPAGGTCTQPVAFTPAAPGLRVGAVVLVGTANGASTVLGLTYISGTGTAETGAAGTGAEGSGALVTGQMIPVAGQPGSSTGVEDGQPATQAGP